MHQSQEHHVALGVQLTKPRRMVAQTVKLVSPQKVGHRHWCYWMDDKQREQTYRYQSIAELELCCSYSCGCSSTNKRNIEYGNTALE